jgi:hypothetical protein
MTVKEMVRVRRARQRAADERGNVLIMSALLMVPLLIFVGFAIDVGSWYARASRIQRAADAAALAGVIWMPDFEKAEEVALETARRNGFVSGEDGITITVSPDPSSSRRLRVAIDDATVETYFASMVTDSIEIGRRAIAEYVLPVPLGSPTNHFGTGDLLAKMGRGGSEYLWASVNGYCTDKVDGDRVLSRYFGNRTNYSCAGTSGVENQEYRAEGYTYYVEVPEGRPSPITLAIYDAPYFRNGGDSPDLPLAYQSNVSTDIDTTFTLFAPDGTPFDDADNPVYSGCGTGSTNPRTFDTNDASVFDYAFGSPAPQRWTRFCTLGLSAPAGKYLLRVKTVGPQPNSTGSNQFSLLARLGTGSFCDSRVTPGCPRIYGKDDMSVFAGNRDSTGEFYLTQVERIHAGKQMLIRLWDPGEGGSYIEILDPAGNVKPFRYRIDGGDFTTSTQTRLDVSGAAGTPNNFNGRSVELLVSLVGYDPPATNDWWKIRYRFGGSTVTDRTTWSVEIIGDPVHLVEER